jgi:hypothetical protein
LFDGSNCVDLVGGDDDDEGCVFWERTARPADRRISTIPTLISTDDLCFKLSDVLLRWTDGRGISRTVPDFSLGWVGAPPTTLAKKKEDEARRTRRAGHP